MAKYDGLRNTLRQEASGSRSMTFEELSAVVPGGLPPSAYRHPAWWANESVGSHVHARAWMDAGWRVTAIDLTGRRVTFTRWAQVDP